MAGWKEIALSDYTYPANQVEIEELGTATYDDIQDWINNTQSAGYVIGGEITQAAGANNHKINVAAMKGFLKITDDATGVTKSFDLTAQSNLDILTDAKVNYVYVKFTAPSTVEVLATLDRSEIELNRQFTLGRVYRDGTGEGAVLHIVQSGCQLANFDRKNHERLVACRGVERASGIVLSDKETRKIGTTAGVFYMGHNKTSVAEQNTAGDDKFTYWSWVDSAWAKTDHDQTQIHDTYYNDVSGVGVLTALTNNKYGVHWVFIDFDGHLQVLYGQGDYKLTEAQDASLPSSIPDFLQYFCLLVGRIIKLEEVAAFTEIASAWEVFFPTTTITDHGELGGLDGDDHSQYLLATGTRAASEIRLTPKSSSSGPEGTMFYDSDDNHVYVGTES